MSDVIEKKKCTGCGVCVNICPKSCISMDIDEEGFYYPKIGYNCIRCNKCYNTCPLILQNISSEDKFKQFSVAGISNDKEIWGKSTSGGAFTEICKVFCSENDVIFGAKFDKNRVVHDSVYGPNNIGCFRKSKYVQSDINDSYVKVEKYLKKKVKVVFSGTPCQVDGLKKFLNKEYDNLLCIDLICHGVGSPGIFSKYIDNLEKKYKSKVMSYEFRNKKISYGKIKEYCVKITLENDNIIIDDADLYSLGFLQGLLLRPSCERCKYTNLKRVGDLTIGDLKNRYKILPEIKNLNNLSTIIVNTLKGELVYKELKKTMSLYKVDIDEIVKSNSPLRNSSRMSNNRLNFMREIIGSRDIYGVLNRNIIKTGILKRIWLLIPDRLRYKIKRSIEWRKK